mmetsp:Transcript_22584/g.28501  ORF Transcript_22584/g.28501 Transcript_22584/m.28501 type:complete len:131 (+) Transcript_22584:171-563(+)
MVNTLCDAYICCYTSCDFDNIKIGCDEASECLCLNSAYCCAIGAKPLGCGMVTENDEICKIGCFICNFGLKTPEVLCAGAGQVCCVKEVVSFPFNDDYVKEPICAICCISCTPEAGCCVKAPDCPVMDRD